MSKMNKNIVPEDFTLGLAIFDIFPVLFFCISVILLGVSLKSILFVVGAGLCAWAGTTKVIWKLIVVIRKKNIWWMFMQMRICMPIGFVLMILAGVIGKSSAVSVWKYAKTMPASAFFILGFVGMLLMGVAAGVLDSSDKKANWIEQTINTIAQLSVMLGVMVVYTLAGAYTADETARSALQSDPIVNVAVHEKDVVFSPREGMGEIGIVFYPGGKVEYTAYAPLLRKLAERGITCVLVEMPLNYAFLDSDRAGEIIETYKGISNWYIAGHSLGGAFAGNYASKHAEVFDGAILLGAYSTKSLKDIPVLLIYGSEDGVLRRKQYEKNKTNLPDDYAEFVIEGGNHAMFGNYGEQAGDGKALISSEEQQNITADFIVDFINSNK